MLFLIFGDSHLFTRAKEIPSWVIHLVKKRNISNFICTGDLVDRYVYDFFKSMGNFFCVRGNCDFLDLPTEVVIKSSGLKIGVVHGMQVSPRGDEKQLLNICKNLDCHILVNGHTHIPKISLLNNRLLINPGSITGCWGGKANKSKESVIIMDLSKEVLLEHYLSSVLVNKYEFKKRSLFV